jgi:hypothetical protein
MNTRMLAAIAAVMAAAALFWHLRPTEEARVRKRVARLAETLSKGAGEKAAATALRHQRLLGLFDDTCIVAIPGRQTFDGKHSATELAAHANRARAMFNTINLSFQDVAVAIAGEDRAVVTLTARLTGADRGGHRMEEVHEMELAMVKRDGDWRFREFRAVEVVRR